MGLGKKKRDRPFGIKRLHAVCAMLGKPRVSVVGSGVLGLLLSKQWLLGDHPRDESTSRRLSMCAYVCTRVHVCTRVWVYVCTRVCMYMRSGRSPKEVQKHAPGSDQGASSMRLEKAFLLSYSVEHGARVKNRVAKREGLPELGKMIWTYQLCTETCAFL